MRSTVLGYGIEEHLVGKLRFLCVKAKVRFRVVTADEVGLPVGTVASSPAVEGEAAKGGPMLVFCGISSRQFSELLAAFRPVVPDVRKAVLTPSNAVWDFETLYRELEAEHRAMKAGTTVHGTEDSEADSAGV